MAKRYQLSESFIKTLSRHLSVILEHVDSKAVREKIDSRNEVNTNISVLDQQIAEQRKRNELEQLKTEQALITSRGLTKEILYKQFIDKWDGRTPIYGAIPDLIKIQN